MTQSHNEQIDAYLEKCLGIIEKHGWMVQSVGTSPMLHYTVGLEAKGHPELVLLGVPPQVAQGVLNEAARQLLAGEMAPREWEDTQGVIRDFPVRFRKLTAAQTKALRIALVFCEGEDLDAWLMVLPDEAGRFAGDPQVNPKFASLQDPVCLEAMGSEEQ